METFTPEWVTEIQREQEQRVASEEARRLERIAAKRGVEADFPKFWSRFTARLVVNESAVKSLGVRAVISDLGNFNVKQKGFRISVFAGFPVLRQQHLNVLYSEGSQRIDCYLDGEEQFSLLFVAEDGKELSVWSERDGELRTAEDAIDSIFAGMVKTVLRENS